MPFDRNKDAGGRAYAVDWAEVNNIVGAHSYLRSFVAHAKQKSEGTMLGSVKTVDFDVYAVRAAKQRLINATMPMVVQTIAHDYREGQRLLIGLRNQTMTFRKRRDALFATAEASGKSFDWWADKAIGATQLVRDTGFAAIAVIGAPIGGTTALVAVAVGAGGASVGKWEDTHNVGATILAGAASLVMSGYGVIAAGAKVAGAGKGIVVAMGCVMDATFEMTGGMLEGKSGADVARAGVAKLITGGLGGAMDHAMSSKIDKIWTEFDSSIKHVFTWKDAATKLTLESSKKGNEKVAGYAIETAHAGSGGSSIAGVLPSEHFVVASVLKAG